MIVGKESWPGSDWLGLMRGGAMSGGDIGQLRNQLGEIRQELSLLKEECLKADGAERKQLKYVEQRLDSMFQALFVLTGRDGLDPQTASYLMPICIGSVLECALQLFLMTYFEDYKKSEWQKWNHFDEDKVVSLIGDSLNQAVASGAMTSKQRKSTLKAAKSYFGRKKREPAVESITLSDLIDFYCSKAVIEESECERFRHFADAIWDGRNCIHIFSNCKEIDYSEMSNLLDEFKTILTDLRSRAQYGNGTTNPCNEAIRALMRDYPGRVCVAVVGKSDHTI